MYIWFAVVHSVIGDLPHQLNCQLKVRCVLLLGSISIECTSVRMTLLTQNIPGQQDKQDCLAVNLQLTHLGKLDTKQRGGFHLGSTLKEVAADAVANFHINI